MKNVLPPAFEGGYGSQTLQTIKGHSSCTTEVTSTSISHLAVSTVNVPHHCFLRVPLSLQTSKISSRSCIELEICVHELGISDACHCFLLRSAALAVWNLFMQSFVLLGALPIQRTSSFEVPLRIKNYVSFFCSIAVYSIVEHQKELACIIEDTHLFIW